ncbi:class I glutamine amidotransferase-like protein [Parachaetomium inaequale]|uniref:Class I glutamine amidotransferase-like protein n=1 Tax=Parachaetomium inaequale TaxID=2588326 RepID=A0AAN6PNE4_9PEZI|nr:class I glutamine amidotransferase-like protein [Parachaetomium inaequale]
MMPAMSSVKLFAKSLAVLLFSLTLINPAAGAVVPRSGSKSCGNDTAGPKPNPRRFGFLLPRAFDVIDVFGPLDILQALSRQTHLDMVLLSRTLDPVTTQPGSAAMNKFNSSFFPTVVPTHTFADAPPIDVLVVPGGAAARSPDLGPEIAYIQKVFPSLQYLITICTGAGIAAQSGVLDGHRATTNKAAWGTVTPMGPKVKWVSPARWVEDGKVWTSSGVTAGLDLTFEFVKQKYDNGSAIAEMIAGSTEHVIIKDWRDDPFSAKFNVPPSN